MFFPTTQKQFLYSEQVDGLFHEFYLLPNGIFEIMTKKLGLAQSVDVNTFMVTNHNIKIMSMIALSQVSEKTIRTACESFIEYAEQYFNFYKLRTPFNASYLAIYCNHNTECGTVIEAYSPFE